MDNGTLKDWVNINSGSTNLAGLSRMADTLSAAMQDLPGNLERISVKPVTTTGGKLHQSGDVLRLRFHEDAPVRILFSGHMDTVYDVNHPFQKFTALPDGRWSGPGIADMKGGLFIMIESLRTFLKSDSGKAIGGEILINADEELGSVGSLDLLREAAQRNHIGLVFESSLPGGELVRRRKGTGTFRLVCHGRAAHTGRDFEQGRNAVAALSDLLLRCHRLNGTIADAIINVANFNSAGPVNVVPDHAEAWLNIRTGKVDSNRQIRDALGTLIRQTVEAHPETEIKIEGDFLRAPKEETPADAALHEIWNTVESRLGLSPSGKRDTGGSSDGNVLGAAGLPHLDGVGITGGAIHSENEFACPESIPLQVKKIVGFLEYFSNNGKVLQKPPFSRR